MTDNSGLQFGSYRLLQLLGRGSMADVYLGEHIQLKTQFAIKVFRVHLSGGNLADFLQEAGTLSRLEHPHIVRLLDFGVQETTPYLVMSYAPNGTLRHCYPHGSVLPLTSIISHIKNITSALQYAHDQKLLHRDIRPENMLLGHNGEVWLSDFRITLAQRSRSPGTQGAANTVAYMAPEHIQGKPCSASDQYALGVVLYEWLSGDLPFHGSFTELCTQHLSVPPPPLREKVPELSPALEEVVQMALAKKVQQRFASVKAFAYSLEQAALAGTSDVRLKATLPAPVQAPSAPVAVATFSPTLMADAATSATVPISVPQPSVAYRPQPPPSSQQRPSRRTVLLGLAGLVSVAGGVTTWLALSRQSQPQKPRAGTLLYTYHGHPTYVAVVAWSPNGQRIASAGGDRTVQVWDSSTGGHVFTYRGHNDVLYATAWSSDGKRIASGGADQTVQVWEAVQGGQVLTYRGHSNTVTTVAWSLVSAYIASASYDTTAQVWSTTNGNPISTYHGHSDAVWAVAWSSDGKRVASASFDRTVQVWNAFDGSPIFTYRGHSAEVRTVAWSPNGKHLASAGFDKTVKVWDATTGKLIATYQGHAGEVYFVAWSPDGTHIASASADRTVQIWNATTGKQTFTYRGHSGYVYTLGWSPNGQRIASGGSDRTVQVWQTGL